MGSAVLAGAVSDIVCNPMFVVRTRLQTEALHNMLGNGASGVASERSKYSGILKTALSLYKEGGPFIFWRGMTANLMGLSHVAVQFPVYEQLKKTLRRHKTSATVSVPVRMMKAATAKLPQRGRERDPIYLWSSLVAGAGSGALASVICAPLDLIRTRLQVWTAVKGSKGEAASTLPRMLNDIIKSEGWRGCFRGLGATLVTVPLFWGIYCK